MAKKQAKPASGGSTGKQAAKKKVAGESVPPAALPSIAASIPLSSPAKMRAAQRKFIEGLISRGEAVPAGQPFPTGATHEITGVDEEGLPKVARRRFSLTKSTPPATKKAAVKRSASSRKKQ